ncbi:MAG: TetR family transcriptional regulator [Thermoleophilia bacterium]|nr:TetR family transcriptional regulator [Thermoleophilia bacterium]
MLEEHGYHGAGLGAVAAAAGVSRQAVYLHFGSKAQLVLALAAHVDEEEGLRDLARAVDEAPTALAALDRFVELVAELTPRVRRTAAVLEAARLDVPEAAAAWRDRTESRRRRCRRIVDRLAREARLAEGWTVEEAADFLWAASGLHVWEDLVILRKWPSERFRRHLRRVLHQALVEPEPAA